MNPDQSSREDIELRITMLLLGELLAEEAAALRKMVSQDAALKRLHDELRSTIGLLREVEKNPADSASENSVTLKLSDERRQKLLAHFKTPRPQGSFWIRPMKLRPLIPALVAVAIVAMLAALLLPALSRRTRGGGDYGMVDALSARTSALSEDNALQEIQEKVIKSSQPASQPTVVTVAPEPVVAPPPAQIVLPTTESPGQPVTITGSLADSQKGPQYTYGLYPSQNNTSGQLSTSTSTGAAATADSLGVQAATDTQTLALNEPAFQVAKLSSTSPQPISSGGTINSQPKMEQAEKQWVVPSGQVAGIVSAKTRSEGLRNTGGFGGGGGGGASGFKPADTSMLAFDDSAANRSRTENGLPNYGEALHQKTPMASAEATATFTMPVAAPPAPDQVATATAYAFAGNDSGNLPQAGLEKKFGGSEITKGASQLRDNEPASYNKHGFYRITPLQGARTATAEGENAETGLAMNAAPTETPPALAPQPPQLQANDGKQVANSFDFDLGKKAETDRNGPVASTVTPPATAGPVMLGDIPATGMLFTSGAGKAAPKQTDKSQREALALDRNIPYVGGTTYGARVPTDVRAQDSFQTGLAKDDIAGLRYLMATNAAAPTASATPAQPDEMMPAGLIDFSSVDVSQVLDVYAKLSNRTVLHSTLPDAKISLRNQKSMTRIEAIETLRAALAANNISVIPVGDKFLKVVQKDQANSVGAVLNSGAVAQADEADKPVRRAPANAPVPQPEVLTSENAFSTFSLNVSDVSFKLAEASLEKGQMPDAAGIRSEEFINAFDYRDPEAAVGQPMAFASERARYPFAHNRELLRFSIKTAAAGRPAGRALNLVLLLDNSGSMERADRVAIIREALRVLAGQLQLQDTVSVVTFARTARLWADGVAGDKAGETLSQVGGITPEGGTNLEEAMRLAYETAHRHYLANGMNRVVLLTDGAANLGNVDPTVLKQNVEAQRKQGIALDCFGIGFDGYDDDLLEQLSRNGDGRYAFINSPEEAGSEFAAKLAGALLIAASDVKVQVEFNPQRVISYRQIGYAKHQLTKEQFRDNTADAAEIAAQEAGNALYTIETKPDGSGPVATVRVRYKVPGTSDYHEWSRDVAYEGNVPALEQASAAMRLAGTASAFSEWLAVSPFAQEVTPDELLKIMSGVPEVYGVDERPKKLEWMIRQAKSISGK